MYGIGGEWNDVEGECVAIIIASQIRVSLNDSSVNYNSALAIAIIG